jgi:hypothetical protein
VSATATQAKTSAGARPSLALRALWRWVTISALLAVLFVLYNKHPYYLRAQFAPWRPLFRGALFAWLALGFPYAHFTVKRFSTRLGDLRDPTLHWMLLARGAWRGRMKHLLRSRRVKTSMLSLVVKAYYAPLMTSFLSSHSNNIARAWALRKGLPQFTGPDLAAWWTYVTTTGVKLVPNASDVAALFSPVWYTTQNLFFACDFYYDIIFFVDTAFGLLGYCSESQWFKNKTRSVEPTMLGWIAAVMWYPPFNDVTGTYLPLDQSRPLFRATWAILLCKSLMLASFTIYAWATVSFGMKFSNLTNRGIIRRGPYRWMRHPAYVCKGFAWWMEYLPNMGLQSALMVLCFNVLYGLRAWTEEKHLSLDPDYIKYKKEVPWVLIPGIY